MMDFHITTLSSQISRVTAVLCGPIRPLVEQQNLRRKTSLKIKNGFKTGVVILNPDEKRK